MEYLFILIVVLFLSLLLEHRFHLHLYRNRKERLLLTGLFFLVGSAWDSYAVWRGHWFFPSDKTIGLTIGLLPLEEYLFFLIVPFFILTVYKTIDAHFSPSLANLIRRLFSR